jgi:hypothetical protein
MMPPGSQRANALKNAGLLGRVADSHGLIFAKKRQAPEVMGVKGNCHYVGSTRQLQRLGQKHWIALFR